MVMVAKKIGTYVFPRNLGLFLGKFPFSLKNFSYSS
jgi:hypothetical protein